MENTTTNNEMALFLFAGLFFAFLIIVGIAMYLSERFKDINYAKMELCRAYDKDEYRYWRRELTICRLLIIPFMSYDTAKKIVEFFSRGKHAKKENRNDGLTSLLLPSFLGIMICAVCLAGGTFAWFTASQSTSTQVIQAANYSVITSVNDGTKNIDSENDIYSLEAGKPYKVTIEANGSATTGYCIIKLGTEELHTEQFPTKDNADKNTIEFTIYVDTETTMEIIAQWGTSTKPIDSKVEDGGTYTHGDAEPIATTNTEEEIEQGTTEQTTENTDADIYTVVSGDTLSGIATKYNTSIEKLVAYNKLADTNIQAGQKLKIPPAYYEIPKAETTSTTVEEDEKIPTEADATATEHKNNITESDNTISNISN